MKKLYICVIDSFPDYMTPTLVAHATLRHHLKYQDDLDYQDWLKNSFRKCVVKVNKKEFEKISKLEKIEFSHENNTLGGDTSCITIIADTNDHKVLKFAKLWDTTTKSKPLVVELYERSMEYEISVEEYNNMDDAVSSLDLEDSEIQDLKDGKTVSHADEVYAVKIYSK